MVDDRRLVQPSARAVRVVERRLELSAHSSRAVFAVTAPARMRASIDVAKRLRPLIYLISGRCISLAVAEQAPVRFAHESNAGNYPKADQSSHRNCILTFLFAYIKMYMIHPDTLPIMRGGEKRTELSKRE